VVRYPALYTRFTRHLVQGLEREIGKLFVVWNMDAACSDLAGDERDRQVAGLREKVAGAHELYTVDARRALAAAQARDSAAAEACGLRPLIDGLGSFAASEKRLATAVREAAKRVDKWMRQADEALLERRRELEASLAETRRQLDAIRAEAEAKAAATRSAREQFGAALVAAQAQAAAKGAGLAKNYRKQLRKLRRRWVWNGDATALREATQAAGDAYADGVDALLRDATNAMHEAAERFGTRITVAPRERIVPAVEALGPEDRLAQAVAGRMRRTRRLLRRRHYLPGLGELERHQLAAELESQKGWAESAERSAEGAAQATLGAQLAEIERAAEVASDQLAVERRRSAEETELAALERDVPVVSRQRATIRRLAAAARDR
jgi:hypothetical protein